MAYSHSEGRYPQQRHYSQSEPINQGYHMEQIEEYDDRNHFVPDANKYINKQAYDRDYLDDNDDIGQFETDPAEILGSSYGHSPQYQYHDNRSYTHSYPSTAHSQRLNANVPPAAFGPPQLPSNTSPLVSPSPAPRGRGANPRNSHGIQLKPVSVLPDIYRSFFKFGVFNAIQSQCYDIMMNTPGNTVISAPTGSGKTVLFELALIRMLMGRNSHDIKCVYMAPTKALCSERYRDWSAKLDPIGIKCCELTGDTVGYGRDALRDAKTSTVLITTPEKFDSLSRNWRDHGDILSRTQLFLIDEVHILNETRGSTLEVVASRMKTRGTSVRFVLVSATVPNIDDIAAWIGNGTSGGPATVFEFGEEFRPCRLTRVVYGYPRKNQNDFCFSRTLDYKLLPLLQQHAENKPVLIFCATRKGVVGTAEVLMKEYQKLAEGKQTVPWTRPRKIEAVFHDSQLQVLATVGLGVHHAGLTMDDRRVTEELFIKKVIRVVVATSTLAVGVNLPAHTVVIKGVTMWQNGGWQEYSDLDFIQMIGRAGRPQFDKEGIAVILCDTEQERKYKALVSGTTLLESSLHVNLPEHLNSEIGLGTITDLNTAQEWLRNSFLFQRIQKNPGHYALDKTSDQTWQARLDALVESSICDLQKNDLVTGNEGGDHFTSTEYGDIMSKFYIRLSTMKSILKLSNKSTIRDLLELISSAEEMSDVRLRAGEKQVYKKMSDHNDIRYRVKVEKAADKVFIIMQAMLGGISLNSPEYKTADSQPYLDALAIFKHAARIARTIAEVAIVKKSGAVLKYGMELLRSLTAKAWEDRPIVLRQIEQIGEKSIKLLNRRAPFGDAVVAAARRLPQYSLKVTEVSTTTFGGDKPVAIELSIECGLIGAPEAKSTKGKERKQASLGMTAILTLTSDNNLVDFRRISH
ncbi:P-loop containing nucleoside triphosphate hydrolase protein, partial [Gautieria morchelliformis]